MRSWLSIWLNYCFSICAASYWLVYIYSIYYYVLYVVEFELKHPYSDISWMEKCVIHSANWYVYEVLKLCFETKMTKIWNGHFTSISDHFFANYISSFHKTKVLTVIFKGPTCKNLNWIKSHDINHYFCPLLLFSIL